MTPKRVLRYLLPPLALLMAFLLGGLLLGGGSEARSGTSLAAEEDEGAVWTCAMHPPIRQPDPGLCPLCEMALIEAFALRPDEVLERDFLLNEVWGLNYYGTTRTLDQHVAQLRKKVEADPKQPATIVTVHGIGYRYVKAP